MDVTLGLLWPNFLGLSSMSALLVKIFRTNDNPTPDLIGLR
jgi:hypothetical protein